VKIVHVYKDFDPPILGGVERHIAMCCRYQRQWADVEAMTCSRTPWTRVEMRDGTRVLEVGEWGRFQSAPMAPLYPWYLRRLKADVIVVHVPNPTAEISYLVAPPRARLVVRYHSDVVRQAAAMRFYGRIQQAFLRRADVIIPTSQRYVETSTTLQPVRDKCRIVPLGVLPEDFAKPKDSVLEGLHARYGGPFVLFSGIHRYYKGLEFLVRAAEAIRARVVIAGDGPERDRNEVLARELGVHIEFPGRLSHEELVAHLHACDVFVFPSVERSEAFGISLLEAQACCKPAVATQLGTGVEYVNLHGETGLNVPPRDPRALAEAVNALLADQGRRQAMGQRAHDRVVTEFHAERVARAEFDLYEEVLRRGASA
jgi:rhamnosyl/mannosyltransferase